MTDSLAQDLFLQQTRGVNTRWCRDLVYFYIVNFRFSFMPGSLLAPIFSSGMLTSDIP
jgi:hypothetical protein